MKRMLFILLLFIICFLFRNTNVKAASDITKNIVIKVGEQYTLPTDIHIIWQMGNSVLQRNNTLKGIKPGNSIVFVTDETKNFSIYKIEVDKSNIEVIMLDIGQGDAFLIKVNGYVILLDTGEKKYYEFLVQQLNTFNVEKIDALIISHMDTDHMGAATLAIKDYGIKTVLAPHTPGNSEEYNKLDNLLNGSSLKTIYVECDNSFSIGDGCVFSILGSDIIEDTNDSSIVMKLTYYDNSFLFTGDASASVLNRIMDEGKDIATDVLKIPHHGSHTSSPILFLKSTGAKIALISVGRDNQYGHPTENVLRRLEFMETDIYRTDKDGTVIIRGDGTDYECECINVVDWGAENRLKVEEGPVIANINSRVFHHINCISLPAEKNRIFFLSDEDAEIAGFRPCGNCIGMSKYNIETPDNNGAFIQKIIDYINKYKAG